MWHLTFLLYTRAGRPHAIDDPKAAMVLYHARLMTVEPFPAAPDARFRVNRTRLEGDGEFTCMRRRDRHPPI